MPSARNFGLTLLCVVSFSSAAPLKPGASRADVISDLGEPAGALTSGPREILSYPDGKITLENGRLCSATFDLEAASQSRVARESPETVAPLPPKVHKAQGTVNVTRGKELEWYSDLEVAKSEAQSHYKQLLVLFTGQPAEPWNSVFTRTVVYNVPLLQDLREEFVLVKLTCPSKSAVDSGDADPTSARALEAFRKRTIGGTTFPALAIVTADGRRAAEVSLSDAENAQGRMAAYVKESIDAAKGQPLRVRGGVPGTFVFGAIVGLLVLVWLLKH